MFSPKSRLAWLRVVTLGAVGAIVLGAAGTSHAAPPEWSVELVRLGTSTTGAFDEGASEIVKYDDRTERLFVVNAQQGAVDVLDVSDPSAPTEVAEIDPAGDLAGFAVGGVNSVDVHRGIVALAVEADPKTDPGMAAFYTTDDFAFLGAAPTGALPDMITFTPSGRHVLIANEGEPDHYDAGNVDPLGSVSIIQIRANFSRIEVVTHADFTAFNGREAALKAAGVRIYGPGASVAQDLEPEYIAVTHNGHTAYVTLQENNAIGVLDLRQMAFTDIVPLGYKDHSLAGNAFDASNRDDGVNITNWPVLGMYQPDAIETYRAGGRTYLVTANEGDAREYDGFEEAERVEDLALSDPALAALQAEEDLGRLNVTTVVGIDPEPCVFDEGEGAFDCSTLYAFGARSFSIWNGDGSLVFDSGDVLEQLTADLLPEQFNSNNDDNDSFDARSDDKGPEPEGLTLGQVQGRTYLFLGLERIGGIMVFDVTDPAAPVFKTYLNHRDFGVDAEDPAALDLGPEGLEFIPAGKSPTGEPMLAVGNEVSGTTTLYNIVITR